MWLIAGKSVPSYVIVESFIARVLPLSLLSVFQSSVIHCGYFSWCFSWKEETSVFLSWKVLRVLLFFLFPVLLFSVSKRFFCLPEAVRKRRGCRWASSRDGRALRWCAKLDLMRPPSSSNQINWKCTHEKEPERHPDGWVHHRCGVPWSSGIALKWESNCQVETTHRYGWRASSKTNHCADKRTESHSEWCQTQTCWVINCILMGLMRTKVREEEKNRLKVC